MKQSHRARVSIFALHLHRIVLQGNFCPLASGPKRALLLADLLLPRGESATCKVRSLLTQYVHSYGMFVVQIVMVSLCLVKQCAYISSVM